MHDERGCYRACTYTQIKVAEQGIQSGGACRNSVIETDRDSCVQKFGTES